jgi:hypothetical protein
MLTSTNDQLDGNKATTPTVVGQIARSRILSKNIKHAVVFKVSTVILELPRRRHEVKVYTPCGVVSIQILKSATKVERQARNAEKSNVRT